MRLYLIFIVACILILSGCATSSVSKNYRLDNKSKEGLVFLSITVDGTVSDYNLSFGTNSDRKFVQFAYGTPASLFEKKDIDNGRVKGKIFAIKMQSGKYKVLRWGINSGTYSNSSSEPINIAFEVKPGKATYIGNYHFVSRKSSAMWKVDATVHQRNEFSRDLQIFKNKYPKIVETSIINSLPSGFSSKQIGGSTSHSAIETPIIN